MNALRFNRSAAVWGLGEHADEVAHFGVPLAEQRKLAMGKAVADLNAIKIYQLTGDDRLSWLNSLTTQKLDQAQIGTSTETLILSPTGHIEHWMRVYVDTDALWLLIDQNADSAVEFLNSMRFMMHVDITDVSAQYQAVGTLGPGPEGFPVAVEWNDPWPTVGVGSASYAHLDLTDDVRNEHPGVAFDFRIHMCPRTELAEWNPAAAGVEVAGREAWEALRIEAWRPTFADADHKTLVGELDILRTAVHLAKGCYRGQEAVARVHNLGQVPRRLVFLHLDGSGHILPQAGDGIFAHVRGTSRVVGHLTAVALHWELGPIALGLVKRNLSPQQELRVEISGTAGTEPEMITATSELIVAVERAHNVHRPNLNRDIDKRSR